MAETLDATTTTDLTYDSASWWWKRLDAKDDWAKTDEDTPKNIDVLTNDVGALGIVKVNGTAVTADTPPVTLTSGATVDLEGKTLLYDPGEAFQGLNSGESKTDTFTYTISGKYKGTDTATVNVQITGVTDDDPTTNDAPVANDDTAYLRSYYPYPLPYEETVDSTTATTTDAPLSDDLIYTTLAIGEEGDPYPYPNDVYIDVLENDTDADGDEITVGKINGQPVNEPGDSVNLDSGATVTLNKDGTLYYEGVKVDYLSSDPLATEGDTTVTASGDADALVFWEGYPIDSFTYQAKEVEPDEDGKEVFSNEATVSIYQSPIYYYDVGTDPVLDTSTDVGDPSLATV